jgi:hypothetical protein
MVGIDTAPVSIIFESMKKQNAAIKRIPLNAAVGGGRLKSAGPQPGEATGSCAPCRSGMSATFIVGRFVCGGNTDHDPSSWRKKKIDSSPVARLDATHT